MNENNFNNRHIWFYRIHLAKLLLDSYYTVIGVDGMTNYYDVNLKRKRKF